MDVNSINPDDVVMIGDIAKRQGVSKAAVQNWTRRADFPKPITELVSGKVYDYGAVVLWREADVARQLERLGRKLDGLS